MTHCKNNRSQLKFLQAQESNFHHHHPCPYKMLLGASPLPKQAGEESEVSSEKRKSNTIVPPLLRAFKRSRQDTDQSVTWIQRIASGVEKQIVSLLWSTTSLSKTGSWKPGRSLKMAQVATKRRRLQKSPHMSWCSNGTGTLAMNQYFPPVPNPMLSFDHRYYYSSGNGGFGYGTTQKFISHYNKA